jgi:hypothetical protein
VLTSRSPRYAWEASQSRGDLPWEDAPKTRESRMVLCLLVPFH